MNNKMIGVYLDHAHARVMESVTNALISQVIHSGFTHEEMEFTLSKSENVMHHKEQGEQTQYYEDIMDKVKDARHILLFGPTKAKNELYNLMRADDRFAGARVEVESTDKLQPDQQENFLKEHFKINN